MTNTITVSTTVKKSTSQVWEYFTNPIHIVNWNHASSDWHCPMATNDLRVNGRFSSIMSAKDSSSSFDFNGVYTKIEIKKQIEYVLEGGREVQVMFESLDQNTTKVTENFEAENANTPEKQREGWQAILDNFKTYIEAN